MLLSAVSVLVVVQSSSEIPEGLMNNPVYPTRCNVTQFIYIWKLLYMFRVVSPSIIRSTHNCIYSIWYLSNSCTIAVGSSNGLTNTRCCRYSVVCAPDDGWRYNPKHVEQFPDI